MLAVRGQRRVTAGMESASRRRSPSVPKRMAPHGAAPLEADGMHQTSSRTKTNSAGRCAAAAISTDILDRDDASASELLGADATNLLRRTFFRETFDIAARYGVTMEDVLEHCAESFDLAMLDTPILRMAAAERIAGNLEDLLLAIACIRRDQRAWHDLDEIMRPMLARMCELRVDEIESMLQASRFLRAVRHRTLELDPECEGDDGTPRLQEFTGLQPLRSFLGGPLFSLLQDLIRDGLVEGARGRSDSTTERLPLRLAD
jgi:hypothetical protein